jgi:hypothetical protein
VYAIAAPSGDQSKGAPPAQGWSCVTCWTSVPSRRAMKSWDLPASSREMYDTIVPSGETA